MPILWETSSSKKKLAKIEILEMDLQNDQLGVPFLIDIVDRKVFLTIMQLKKFVPLNNRDSLKTPFRPLF